ncbi:cytochrome P450 [Desertimonas flava]|uniref:cytochrome P450 n=1 Tax=Desertimonas flava TaxID=2064846 RepID=UPI000E35224A|nr:cytochrome P450 [Desertimonas flava]
MNDAIDEVRPPEVPDNVAGLRTIDSYHLVSEVLRSPRFGNGRPDLPRMRGTLPVIDGDEHRERRRRQAVLFTPAAIEAYERDILRRQLDRFSAECRGSVARGDIVAADLVELGLSWLTQVAARIAGIDGVHDDASAARLRDLTEGRVAEYAKVDDDERRRIDEDDIARRAVFATEFFAPSLARRRQMVADVASGRASPDSLPRDVLTLLVDGAGPAWDEELALREVLVYLAGSIRTTARSLVHLTAHLAAWFADHPADLERRTDPAFVRAAAEETLRLHPVLPVLLRKASERVELSDGSVVAEGERLALLFGAANRDPAVFGPTRNVFDPYRDVSHASVPGYGLAFAAGPHTCIGRRLAMGSADPDGGAMGSLVAMGLRLQAMGARPDPDAAPVYDESTFYDEYARFPVLVDPWQDAAVAMEGAG